MGSGPHRACLRILACALALAATFPAGTEAADPLVFYGDDTSPPYQFLDRGEPRGLNVDLLRAIGRRMGQPVEVRLTTAPEAFAKVTAGAGDGLVMLTRSPERERDWLFTEPTVTPTFSLFMRTGDAARLGSEPLPSLRLGVQERTFSHAYLRGRHPEAQLKPVRDFIDGIRDMLLGEIDAFAHLTATGAFLLEELRIGGVTFAERPFAASVAGIAVPRSNPALLARVDQALRDLKRDGTYDAIVDRWTPERVTVIREREVWLAAAALGTAVVSALLLAALALRLAAGRRALAREVQERRRAEETVRAGEGRLRRVVEGAPFPVMVHAEDGEVVHVSRALLDLTGYRAEDLRTMADWATRAYGEGSRAVRGHIDRLYALDRAIDEGDFEVRAADGRTLLWAFRSTPVGRDPAGRRLVASMAADLTERRATEERLRLLMREVDHRAKNALAVVSAVVQLSRAEDPRDFAAAVQGRVAAMARAHSLLAGSGWSGADLGDLVEGEVSAFDGRVEAAGPPVAVRAEAAQAVTLVLHELATNAAKHGALSRPEGRLRVCWSIRGRRGLRIDWEESGGPAVPGPPGRLGFGTTLVRQTVERQLRGAMTVDWRPEGLRCGLLLPQDVWHASGVTAAGEVAASLPPPALGEGLRVLVVEDEALTALAMGQALEEAGHEVLGPVARVQDALDLARTGRPDAAVLDVNLFGETVRPVADALHGMGVPFLFCTGYEDLGGLPERYAGAPVLAKPVSGAELAVALGRLSSTAA